MRWSPVQPGLYEFDIVPKEGVVVKSQVKEPLLPVTFLPFVP
jgi:circadian clock protein KaiC